MSETRKKKSVKKSKNKKKSLHKKSTIIEGDKIIIIKDKALAKKYGEKIQKKIKNSFPQWMKKYM